MWWQKKTVNHAVGSHDLSNFSPWSFEFIVFCIMYHLAHGSTVSKHASCRIISEGSHAPTSESLGSGSTSNGKWMTTSYKRIEPRANTAYLCVMWAQRWEMNLSSVSMYCFWSSRERRLSKWLRLYLIRNISLIVYWYCMCLYMMLIEVTKALTHRVQAWEKHSYNDSLKKQAMC